IFLRIKKKKTTDGEQLLVSTFKEPFGPLMMEMENRPWHARTYANSGQSWAEYLESIKQRTEACRQKAIALAERAVERSASCPPPTLVDHEDTLLEMSREANPSAMSMDDSMQTCHGNSTTDPSESNLSSPALVSSKAADLEHEDVDMPQYLEPSEASVADLRSTSDEQPCANPCHDTVLTPPEDPVAAPKRVPGRRGRPRNSSKRSRMKKAGGQSQDSLPTNPSPPEPLFFALPGTPPRESSARPSLSRGELQDVSTSLVSDPRSQQPTS
ncbi:hypothetical protein HDV03_000424, partial [Kappamyces sp. JEL0829]